MLRMAIRGLFARKLRTALTGFAVVIGVAFVSGTFIFTDTINASFTDLFERVSKGVDVDVTAKQPVEGDFGGRIQPLPAGHAGEGPRGAAASRRPSATSRQEVSIFDDERGARRRQRPADDPLLAQRASASTRTPTSRAAGGAARPGHDRPGHGRPARLRGRRQGPRRRPGAGAGLRARRHRQDRRPGVARHRLDQCRSRRCRRSRQKPGELTEVVVAADGGTSPEELKARISQALGGTAVVRTGKEQAEESAARHQRLARLPHHRPARVRRRSPCSSAAS